MLLKSSRDSGLRWLGDRLAAGGALVLSGVLTEQVDAVVEAYPGLTVASQRQMDGWAAVTLRAAPG